MQGKATRPVKHKNKDTPFLTHVSLWVRLFTHCTTISAIRASAGWALTLSQSPESFLDEVMINLVSKEKNQKSTCRSPEGVVNHSRTCQSTECGGVRVEAVVKGIEGQHGPRGPSEEHDHISAPIRFLTPVRGLACDALSP